MSPRKVGFFVPEIPAVIGVSLSNKPKKNEICITRNLIFVMQVIL